MIDLDAISDKLYDAALDPAAWSGALQDVATAYGGLGVSVIDLDGCPRLVEVTPSLDDLVGVYQSTWGKKDPAVAWGVKNHFRPGILSASQYMSEDFKARNDYCQEFMRPQGIWDILHLLVSPFSGSLRSINIQRLTGAGPVTPEVRRSFERVARHIGRASAIRMRLERADAIQGALADRLSDFDCAAAVVDRGGQLLLANAAFDGLSADGLRLRGGHLRVDSHAMQERLDRLIAQAFGENRGALVPDTLAIARPGSLLPLLVRAAPLKAATAERLLIPAPVHGVLLIVLNPDHPAYPDVTKALVSLGLTPRQSRVAVLIAGGLSPKAASEELGISEATVRTTMKHLYQRLGVTRQVELARLVAKAAPFRI